MLTGEEAEKLGILQYISKAEIQQNWKDLELVDQVAGGKREDGLRPEKSRSKKRWQQKMRGWLRRETLDFGGGREKRGRLFWKRKPKRGRYWWELANESKICRILQREGLFVACFYKAGLETDFKLAFRGLEGWNGILKRALLFPPP